MVNEITTLGLIVTHCLLPSELLDEFIALCGWPVVTQPNLRKLIEQIEFTRPLCLIFWLDASSELQSASKLIAQLRARGPRPYRIAVAHALAGEVEHPFRTAGVHTYLATSGNISALVERALLPFMEPQRASVRTPQASVEEAPIAISRPKIRTSPTLMRPP